MDQIIETDLEGQIEEARRSISADGYPMSIGELTNLYRDEELRIRPEFQRLFRWTDTQKSRLVESLLLGIPLPSIFVAQTESGKWELVDGLQRVSTILQLQGELLDEKGVKVPPLVLKSTKFLSALDGRLWQHPDSSKSLSEAQRLDIKRSKIDIKIIKRGSSPEAKFDLFQRLNSYGSTLTAQETRSALLVAVSPSFFSWLETLVSHESFVRSTSLSERFKDERFDLELVLRFLILHSRPPEKLTLTSLRDLPQVLDDESIEIAKTHPDRAPELRRTFVRTFDFIALNGADKVFRRWDHKRREFKGSFLVTAFEVFALGVGYHIANGIPHRTDLLEAVKQFWMRPEMQGGFATGKSTERRLVDFVPLGRALLSPTGVEAGDYIEYLVSLSEAELRIEIESRISETIFEIVDSEEFSGAISETNASGFSIDDYEVGEIVLMEGECIASISFSSDGDQLLDKPFCGNRIIGEAAAIFNGEGEIEYRSISAEVDYGDDSGAQV